MRRLLVVLHRWFGLAGAGFLCLAGVSGAIIAWEHELDAWLNPSLFRARPGSARELSAADAIAMAERIEAHESRLRVRYLPLGIEPGAALQLFVEPRRGTSHPLAFNQLAIDPASGRPQARRMWGTFSLARENVIPFIYSLHYSLHLPNGWGVWWMGAVAMMWTIDCFIALSLAFPKQKTWSRALMFSSRRLTFDLHRSGGVWTWLCLLVIAVTAVSMNLEAQVVRPVLSLFSRIAEDPNARELTPQSSAAPEIDRTRALAIAQAEAARLQIGAPPGAITYVQEACIYGVGFFAAGGEHGERGLGNPWVFVDARDGTVLATRRPGHGSAGDLFLQAQFPLHSGRLFGLFGRVMVSLLGLVVALLSVTGVVLWTRKHHKRAHRRRVGRHARPARSPV